MNILRCLSFKYWLVAVGILGAFSCEPQPPAVKSKALIIHKEIAPSALKYNKITYTINFVSKEDTLTKKFYVDMVNGSGSIKLAIVFWFTIAKLKILKLKKPNAIRRFGGIVIFK